MPLNHQPDYDHWQDSARVVLNNQTPTEKILDCMRWSYLKLEELMKPHSLPVYINARGRNLPWTFALSEAEFCVWISLRFKTVEQILQHMRSAMKCDEA